MNLNNNPKVDHTANCECTSNGVSMNNVVFDSTTLLARVEAALDRNYRLFPIPHPNKTLAIWYLLTVAEDYQRNLFMGFSSDMLTRTMELEVDRLKYSLRYGLNKILDEAPDQSTEQVPRRIVPMLYERTGRLLFGGCDFVAAVRLCSAAHAGTVSFVYRKNGIDVLMDEQQHDKSYAALELIGPDADTVDFAGLFFRYLRFAEHRPPVLERIGQTVKVRKGLIKYEYVQDLAIQLAQDMDQPSFLVPEGWEFSWGGRAETTLLLNALSVRCLYHLAAVHFGSVQLALRGLGAASICLVLTRSQLEEDLELMSSLSQKAIAELLTCAS
jgi:hypothetical protein